MTDGGTLAFLGLAALLLLIVLRMSIGVAMLLVGCVGIWVIRPQAAIPKVAAEIFNEASNYQLSIIPLFVLMGNLAAISGMSRDLYDAAYSWFGNLRGGLASASVVGCAGFSALSGSSLAAALTMGRVALPEMERRGYDHGLATGAVAAGGTLGILIPPSAGFVIYAILTEESISRLFMAGVLPGLLLSTLFVLAIWLVVWRSPEKAPAYPAHVPLGERMRVLGRAGWIIGITALTISGIYLGAFSAVEAAGIGALLALMVAALRRKLSLADIGDVFARTLTSTGTVFLILFGAFVFKSFIGFTNVTYDISTWVAQMGFTGPQIVIAFLAVIIVLGMVLDGFAILVLTAPVIHSILSPMGVDMIWFGVLMVIVLEMGLISPPVGMNVFVVKSLVPSVGIGTIFRGIWPFWFAMLLAVVLILAIPDIALLLPTTMFG